MPRIVCFLILAVGIAQVCVKAEDMPDPGVASLDLKLQEQKSIRSKWIIEPHRPNYVLPLSYVTDPSENLAEEMSETSDEMQNVEIKFQISFRLQIVEGLFRGHGDLYGAYTQVSVWQAYNSDNSAPFRDTNYEPELFLAFKTDYKVFGLTGRVITLGAVHQSNGRGSEILSRSWNRLYATFVFERGDFMCSLKPWWRFPEDEEDDNNPNIEKYYGYGEFRASYKWGEQVFSTMLRNNLRVDGNKGAIELGWSFPLIKAIHGYVQYFNGFGETLLDYNERDQRFGIGFLMADWL